MERINNESELITKIRNEVLENEKQRIVFIAGHFPLKYEYSSGFSDSGRAYSDFRQWGAFSHYSLNIACKLASKLEGDKTSRFAFIVDDIIKEPNALKEGISPNQIARYRNQFYKQHSGDFRHIDPRQGAILAENLFYEDNYIVRHNHGKEGRTDCVYISEKVLRAERKDIPNECAKAYIGFLENPQLFDKRRDHLVAFIPTRCRDNICNVALPEVEGLSASHISMPAVSSLVTPQDIWESGQVVYHKD